MKKIVSLGLAAAMAASVLTGCGGGSAQTADTKADAKTEDAKGSEAASDKAEGTATAEGMTEITWWAFPTFTQDGDTPAGTYEQEIIDAFEAKNPDINYVGIEKYSSVLIRALEKMSEMETPLANIRFVRMDAEAITKVFGFFAASSIRKRPFPIPISI